ncbi:MAG: biotin transporter BioY [Desulfatibacillaceae bacterium]
MEEAMSEDVQNEAVTTRGTVHTSLMAAMIACGAYIVIPVGPVPVVLQNFFVLLAGLLLGPVRAAAAMGVYYLAGIAGAPVFSGGGAGWSHFLGPTGGYLLGYLPAVVIVGIFARLGARVNRGPGMQAAFDAMGMILGMAAVYGMGVPWLAHVANLPAERAIQLGLWPFVGFDALKIVAALPVAASVRRTWIRMGWQM